MMMLLIGLGVRRPQGGWISFLPPSEDTVETAKGAAKSHIRKIYVKLQELQTVRYALFIVFGSVPFS
jgi:hypothetical protein